MDLEEHIPALRRYASALLRDPQDVDDLVHECLMRAIDRRKTRDRDIHLRAWLFTILHNLFVSRLRRLRVRGQSVPLEDVDLVRDATQESAVEIRDVVSGLDALPLEYRQTLLLVAVEGLGYAEVAAIQGVALGTVMSRLHRARERLRNLLDVPASQRLRSVK